MQLTKSETAIGNFAWSEDGTQHRLHWRLSRVPRFRKIARTISAITKSMRKEYNYAHLWTLDV